MSNRFSSRQYQPWFRIGRFDITTTVIVSILTLLSWIPVLFVPGFVAGWALIPQQVLAGEFWRLATWPFANALSLWGVLYLLMFWYFGSDLERDIGRGRMMQLLLLIWVAITGASLAVGAVMAGSGTVMGLRLLQFLVLLVWIAEDFRRPFFMNVSSGAVGFLLVMMEVLDALSRQSWGEILVLLVVFVVVAIGARRLGMLSDLDWIPGRPRPVVAPVARNTAPTSNKKARSSQRQSADAARIDQLLDKINTEGMHALSQSERRELKKLRDRLKGRQK